MVRVQIAGYCNVWDNMVRGFKKEKLCIYCDINKGTVLKLVMAGFVPDNAEYTYQFNGNNFIVFARRK